VDYGNVTGYFVRLDVYMFDRQSVSALRNDEARELAAVLLKQTGEAEKLNAERGGPR
jgi:hypothetical protein